MHGFVKRNMGMSVKKVFKVKMVVISVNCMEDSLVGETCNLPLQYEAGLVHTLSSLLYSWSEP